MKHFDRLGFRFSNTVTRELEDRRTFYNKMFLNDDNTMSLRAQLGTPIHYREETLNPDSPMIDIDLEPEVFSDRWEFNRGIYRLIVTNTGEVRYTSRAFGDMTWRLLQIGNSTNFHIAPVLSSQGMREFVTFEDIRPGVDLIIRIGSAKMEPLFRLKGPQASREFMWEIDQTDTGGAFVIGQGGRGWEDTTAWTPAERKAAREKRRKLEISKIDGAPLIQNGRRKVTSEEVWTGDMLEVDEQRKPVKRIDQARYPVIVDPPDVSEVISAGVDDVSQSSGTLFNSAGTSFYVLRFNDRRGGVRFRSVPISQGQSLSVANLIVVRGAYRAAYTGLIVAADDVDDAALWSASSGPHQIAPTAATAMVPTGSGTITVPVTGIVQEVLNRTGWTSNADMRFAMRVQTPAALPGGGVFAAYEHATLNPAKLEITFSLANPGATGVLVAGASDVTGVATKSQPVADGVLAADAAAMTGAAARNSAADGVLTAQEAGVAGDADVISVPQASGVLAAQEAAVAGDATTLERWIANGALNAQTATVAGDATTLERWAANGSLAAQEASIAGIATLKHLTDGALLAQSAIVQGQAVLRHFSAGALAAQAATMKSRATAGDGWSAPESGGETETWAPVDKGGAEDWQPVDTGGNETWQ